MKRGETKCRNEKFSKNNFFCCCFSSALCKLILRGEALGFSQRARSGLEEEEDRPRALPAAQRGAGLPASHPRCPSCPLLPPPLILFMESQSEPRSALSDGGDKAKMDQPSTEVHRGEQHCRADGAPRAHAEGPAGILPGLGSCCPRTSPTRMAAQCRHRCPALGLCSRLTAGRPLAPIPCPVPLQKGSAGKQRRTSCLQRCIHPFPPSWGSVLPVPLVGCPHHFGPFYRSPSCGSGCHHRHAFMRVGLCKACIKCSQKYEVLSFVKLIKTSNNFYKGKMSHWMAHFSLLAFYN